MNLHTCYVATADTRNSKYEDEEVTSDMIFGQSFTILSINTYNTSVCRWIRGQTNMTHS